jgi:hypothetical protein
MANATFRAAHSSFDVSRSMKVMGHSSINEEAG